MRKLLLGLVAVIAVAAPVSLVSAPAEAAGNPPCISRTEFKTIKNGMTVTQVKRIVGSAGSLSLSSGSFKIRDHNACAAWHISNVSYTHGRVSGKLYI